MLLFPVPDANQIRVYFFALVPADLFVMSLDRWACSGTLEDLGNVMRPRAHAVASLCAPFRGDSTAIIKTWIPTFAHTEEDASVLLALLELS